MKLTKPNFEFMDKNESLVILKNRMLVREGKSEETLRRYLGGVSRFTEYMQAASPDDALKMISQAEDRTMVLDGWIDWLILQKIKPVSIKALWQGVKKWLIANRINNIDWEYISRPKVASQIKDRIPTTDELRLILSNKVSLRDKAFFMTAASSGLRLGTLPTLKVKDFLTVEELGKIKVDGAPGRKLATGRSYFTFVTPETRRLIEDYLKSRGPLTPDAPLFAKENGEPMSRFVQNVSRQWRRVVKRANLLHKIKGHKWVELHGHTLRKFFQTRCKLAGCRADFVDFWMGHHPARPDEYLNNSYFRPDIDEHLAEYRKAVPELSVFEKTQEDVENLKARLAEVEAKLRAATGIRGTSDLIVSALFQDPRFEKLVFEKIAEQGDQLEVRDDTPSGEARINKIRKLDAERALK